MLVTKALFQYILHKISQTDLQAGWTATNNPNHVYFLRLPGGTALTSFRCLSAMSFKIDVVFLDVIIPPLIISCTGAYKRLRIQCLAGLNTKQLACFKSDFHCSLVICSSTSSSTMCICVDSDIMYIY